MNKVNRNDQIEVLNRTITALALAAKFNLIQTSKFKDTNHRDGFLNLNLHFRSLELFQTC